MLFHLDFAINTISLFYASFHFFFLIIVLYFLIPPIIAQIFNLIAELVIPMELPIKQAKAEIEIQAVIVEAKIRKCSM